MRIAWNLDIRSTCGQPMARYHFQNLFQTNCARPELSKVDRMSGFQAIRIKIGNNKKHPVQCDWRKKILKILHIHTHTNATWVHQYTNLILAYYNSICEYLNKCLLRDRRWRWLISIGRFFTLFTIVALRLIWCNTHTYTHKPNSIQATTRQEKSRRKKYKMADICIFVSDPY